MPSPDQDPINRRLEWAVQIAREAGDGTLRHFRTIDLRVDRKADDSPVTIADREAEELLRRRIAERFPDDAILGEEFGATAGTSGFQWVLDPIDGTKSFIHGAPLYTTLIAVMEQSRAATGTATAPDSQPCIGVIAAPATGEIVYARRGGGCWYIPGNQAKPRASHVSTVGKLSESLLLTTDIGSFAKRSHGAAEAMRQLESSARLTRTWGDGYGYLLVATGRAEVMIDPEMNLWDIAALQPVIVEAGGSFTDWQGRETVHSRDAIATNGRVTSEVLAIVRGS